MASRIRTGDLNKSRRCVQAGEKTVTGVFSMAYVDVSHLDENKGT
jgi:hypothetical protein